MEFWTIVKANLFTDYLMPMVILGVFVAIVILGVFVAIGLIATIIDFITNLFKKDEHQTRNIIAMEYVRAYIARS